MRYVSQDTYDNWFRGHPEPGDLIFVCKGSPGRVCLAPEDVNFCIAQDMVAVRADSTKVYNRYLLAALRTREIQERIANLHVGTLIPHFKKGDFDKLLIPVPDWDVQVGIGNLYYFLSRKIDLNERMAATVDSLIASMYELAVSDDENHEQVTLGDVAAVNERSTRPVLGGSLRYVDISSVSVGAYEWPERISWSDAPGRARRKASVGDTIWSTVRPNRRSHALVLDGDPELVFSSGLAVLSPTGVGPALFYEATRTADFQGYLESVAEGSAYPAVRANRFKDAPITLPSRGKREAFEKVAMSLRLRVHQGVVESRTLAALRDTLLPQLMSGKLRIRDAEKIVEDAV
ncbi:restriction endonuclease subunit S [Streptomyces achromogenes]|uniref:restriction endonuclease subunit S n=1 Tax=Streptomyces achromogenes TaxID=67255 RepID=UPI00343C19A4